MNSCVKGVSALAAVLLAFAASAEPFADGDTVVFLGDSITHSGRYHEFIADFYRTRYPERRIRFVNSGIGGDSAVGAMKRIKEDVEEYRPTRVAIHFGMNDIDRGVYTLKTNAGLLRRRADAQACYRANLDALIAKVKAAAPQAALIYLSTTIYDDTAVATNIPKGATGWATVNQVGCSAGLAQMAGHVLSKAKAEGVMGVDWYSPLNDYLIAHQAADPHFMLTSWDRVHPGALGHSIMAWTFLEAQGVSPVVSEVRIDAAKGEVAACENATVSDLAVGDEGLSFSLLENSLPFPVDPSAREAALELNVAERLNRETLAVAGLSGGCYALLIDGAEVGRYCAEELAAGVNLAFNEKTPQYAQAQSVARRLASLRGWEVLLRNHHSARWAFSGKTDVDDLEGLKAYVAANDPDGYFSKFVPGYVAYWPTYRETRAKLLEKQNEVYALAKPGKHLYELRRVVQ